MAELLIGLLDWYGRAAVLPFLSPIVLTALVPPLACALSRSWVTHLVGVLLLVPGTMFALDSAVFGASWDCAPDRMGVWYMLVGWRALAIYVAFVVHTSIVLGLWLICEWLLRLTLGKGKRRQFPWRSVPGLSRGGIPYGGGLGRVPLHLQDTGGRCADG